MNLFAPDNMGERPSLEKIKRNGWRQLGILVVPISDSRLTWGEKELLRQIGEKLYGTSNDESDKWND